MSVLTGAQIIIQALLAEGVDTVFGYPGASVVPIFDELYRHPEIKLILTRHEQAAVHAADGYARSTGKVGVVLVTSGPGATNTVTGLATANFDSSPIICMTGQVQTTMIGVDAFQEADITGITNGITKHNYLVSDVAELASVLKHSFYIASTGRPGPVLIDLPKDAVLGSCEFDYDFPIKIRGYKPHLYGHPNQLRRAADMIAEAKKPLVIVGGGAVISDAAEQINELLYKCDMPATSTLNGLGVVPFDSPYFLGMHGMHGKIAANLAIQECDLIIACGSRFDDRATGRLESFAPNAKIIHIDVDTATISKNVTVNVPIVGDLRNVLNDLLPLLNEKKHSDWMKSIDELKEKYEIKSIPNGSRVSAYDVFDVLNNRVSSLDNGVIVTDVGQHQMWTALLYQFSRPRSFITSGGFGTMGFGLPASVGVQLANPDKKVVCISGDGSIQMNIQELATAVINRLPIIILILNNGFLGMVRQLQDMANDGRFEAVCLMNCHKHPSECKSAENDCRLFIPDFVKLAESYGAFGVRVTTDDELDKAIAEALLRENVPTIIDIITERKENVWPMVPAGSSLDEILSGGKPLSEGEIG